MAFEDFDYSGAVYRNKVKGTFMPLYRRGDTLRVHSLDRGREEDWDWEAQRNIQDRMLREAEFAGIAEEREARRRSRGGSGGAIEASVADWQHGSLWAQCVGILARGCRKFTASVPPRKAQRFEDDYYAATEEAVDWGNRAILLLQDLPDEPVNKKHYQTVIVFEAPPSGQDAVSSLSPRVATQTHKGARPGAAAISHNGLSRELLGLGFRFSLGPQDLAAIRRAVSRVRPDAVPYFDKGAEI